MDLAVNVNLDMKEMYVKPILMIVILIVVRIMEYVWMKLMDSTAFVILASVATHVEAILMNVKAALVTMTRTVWIW